MNLSKAPSHLATLHTLFAIYPDARNPFAFPELLEEGLDAWIKETGDRVPEKPTPDKYDRRTGKLPEK